MHGADVQRIGSSQYAAGDCLSSSAFLRAFVQRRNWQQQLTLEEPARNGRQDNRRETDHGSKDQQARIADHTGLKKSVAREKQDMSESSGGVRHAHDLAAVRSANRADVNDPDG